MPQIEKKLRIQLFDQEMNMISDRLIAQDSELIKGPKEPHPNPLKIEFCLFSQEDTENAIEYLKRISKIIPLVEPKKHKKKVKLDMTTDRMELYKQMKADPELFGEGSNTEQAIEKLRAMGFVYITYDLIKLLGIPIELHLDVHKEFFYLIKLVKRAKNPMNDKYDPTLMFATALEKPAETATRKFHAYIHGKYEGSFALPANKPKLRIKDKEVLRFPPYMVEEERIRFSKEHRMLLDNPSEKPTKFYERWLSYVKIIGNSDKKDVAKG